MTLRTIGIIHQYAINVRSLVAWTLTTVLCAATAADASTILNVAGSTAACFGASCTTFSTTTNSGPTYNLTFTGSTFDVLTGTTGSATDFVLGSIARGQTNTPSSTDPLPFTLEVTFTLPTGIGGGQNNTFSALIKGTSSNGGGGPLPVDFDNSWIYFAFANAFGAGSFEFAVTSDFTVNKNNADDILGSIRNAVFTPASPVTNPPPGGTVPEPSVLVLLGTAAAALTRRRWKRAR